MEVPFTPEVEKKLNDLVAQTGREILDSPYDDLKSGKVKPIDGAEFFEGLRRREDELLKKQPAE